MNLKFDPKYNHKILGKTYSRGCYPRNRKWANQKVRLIVIALHSIENMTMIVSNDTNSRETFVFSRNELIHKVRGNTDQPSSRESFD